MLQKTDRTAIAGKAVETTAAGKDQGTKGLKDQGTNGHDTLTSEGISSLLRSQLSRDADTETPLTPEQDHGTKGLQDQGTGAESEVQGEGGDENHEGGDGDQGTKGLKDQGTEDQEQGAESQEQDQEAGSGEQGQLPQELQAAIEQWESAGRGELPAVLQSLVDRRIGRLTGQREQERTAREAAEARATELEARLTAAESKEQGAGSQSQIPGPGTEKELGEMERAANGLLADAENYLDETATEDEVKRVEAFMGGQHMDKNALKRFSRDISRWINQELPKQRQALASFKADEAKLEPEARKLFPWLWDKASKEYGQAQDVLRVMPDLVRRTPGHRMALGIYVLGLKALEAMKKGDQGTTDQGTKGPTTKTATAKAPVKTPGNGAAAPRVATAANGKERLEEAARVKLRENPSRANVTELLRQTLR